jgi:hypothetical protein
MAHEWNELTRLTRGDDIIIERVRIIKSSIIIEGSFDLPPLARLNMEDQIFAAAFLRCHGSIKQMEQLFGVSYPTVKNRLAQIEKQLDFINIEAVPSSHEILEQLDRGEITVSEALKKLSRQ